jgi:hypothetical protein
MGTHTTLRRIAGAVAAAVLAPAGLLAVTAGPASAEDGYRYWNYFHADGDTFAFADTGPGDYTPKDGDVEGWRYGTSSESVGIEPRVDLATVDFDAVCEGTEAGSGEKRVAVLVDYGTEADSAGAEVPEPTAYCAVAPTKANGQQVLESVVDVRTEQGGICALDGYPASGCFETVKDATIEADQPAVEFALPAAATAATDSDTSSDATSDGAATADDTDEAAAEDDGGISWPLVAVIALVVVIGAVAIPLSRRNRDA